MLVTIVSLNKGVVTYDSVSLRFSFCHISVMRKNSVHTLRIGDSEIPIHEKDLRQSYPEAVKLVIAEIEASAIKERKKDK